RSARAGGVALRPGGVPTAETQQTRGASSTVWLPAGGGRASVYRPSLHTPDGGLYPPAHVSRAAKAEDPANPPDDVAAHCGPAACALCYGRLALGRSVHVGVSQPPGRPGPHRPYPGAVHFSARLQSTLDRAFAPHAGDAATLATAPGSRDGRSGRAQQDAP